MQFAAIVLLALSGAVVYGILHDQISAPGMRRVLYHRASANFPYDVAHAAGIWLGSRRNVVGRPAARPHFGGCRTYRTGPQAQRAFTPTRALRSFGLYGRVRFTRGRRRRASCGARLHFSLGASCLSRSSAETHRFPRRRMGSVGQLFIRHPGWSGAGSPHPARPLEIRYAPRPHFGRLHKSLCLSHTNDLPRRWRHFLSRSFVTRTEQAGENGKLYTVADRVKLKTGNGDALCF
jgi:hypothetical protein